MKTKNRIKKQVGVGLDWETEALDFLEATEMELRFVGAEIASRENGMGARGVSQVITEGRLL